MASQPPASTGRIGNWLQVSLRGSTSNMALAISGDSTTGECKPANSRQFRGSPDDEGDLTHCLVAAGVDDEHFHLVSPNVARNSTGTVIEVTSAGTGAENWS
jgi:hypothetical protein